VTAATIAPIRIPNLGRLWLWTGIIALASHIALAMHLSSSLPQNSAGGGGQVLGALSVALGGPSVEASPQVEETPAELEASQPTEPAAEPSKVIPAARPKPQPVVHPSLNLATVMKPAHKPTQQRTSAPVAEPAEKPVEASVKSNATPTLGEGAVAPRSGSGGSVNTSAKAHDAYLALLRARIEANRTYPTSARRAGQEGSTSIRLVIIANGSLREASVVESSGHFALDRAAKRMVQKAAPFPTPPGTTFDVTVPIAFALR